MKKTHFIGILSIILVFAFAFIGCDNGSSSFNNDAGSFEGTWIGTVMGETATFTVSYFGWTVSIPGFSFADAGNFNREGNTATLFSNSNGKNVGTATIINSTTIQVVLNGNSITPGTYTATKL